MKDFLYAAANTILNLSPSVVIGAVLVALAVALVTGTVYQVSHKRFATENPTVMTGLILAGNVLSMIVAAGYLHQKEERERSLFWPVPPNEILVSRPYSPPPGDPWTSRTSPPMEVWRLGPPHSSWGNFQPVRVQPGSRDVASPVLDDSGSNPGDQRPSPADPTRSTQTLGRPSAPHDGKTSSLETEPT